MVRRGFLAGLVGALGAGIASGLALLGAAFVRATTRPRTASEVRVPVYAVRDGRDVPLKVEDVAVGEPVECHTAYLRLEGWYWQKVERQLYAQRDARGDVELLSRRCTHLGCLVSWKSGAESFACPCHKGVFRRDGSVASGPPPRPLERVAFEVQDGLLEVRAV